MAPQNDAIKHSQATLLLDQAREASGVERVRLRARAEEEFLRLTRIDPRNSAPYVSLASLYVEESKEASGAEDRITLLVRAEKMVGQAFHHCSATPQLLEVSARIDEANGDLEDAEDAYRRAATQAGGDPDYWVGFARFLLRRGKGQEAVKVLNEALDLHPADPLLNYALAQTLERVSPSDNKVIRRAYDYAIAEPVRGFLPQLDYAIYLFLTGDRTAAEEQFRQLQALQLPYRIKARPHRWIQVGKNRKIFEAELIFAGASSAKVRVPDYEAPIFLAIDDVPVGARRGTTLPVHLAFNVFGLRAYPVKPTDCGQSADPSVSDSIVR